MIAGVTLSCVGLATFLIMPTFVESVVTDLGYTEQQVGIVSAVLGLGTTLASLISPLWIRRLSWRMVALATLGGLLAANVAALYIHALIPFIALQGLVGFCGGSLYSLSLTVLSDCRHPHRYFAYAIGAQTMYEVAALFAGPLLIHRGGVNAMLELFGALCLLGLPLVRFVPAQGHTRAHPLGTVPAGSGLLSAPVLLSLLGCFLFYTNVGAFWTYIERIGTAAGISLVAVANGLSFATAASMGGVFIASWLGGRWGYLMPIAVSALAVVLAALLLTGELHVTGFVVANVIYGIAWNLSMTYQYSVVNRVDGSRRGVSLSPAFHSAGGAAGPAMAALFVTETDHAGVLWVVGVSVVASLACFQIALRLHTRARASADARESRVAAR
jgi:predicted MFS family arabinose efflux permease